MAIKNTLYGGTDWTSEILNALDINDTMNAVVAKLILNSKFRIDVTYDAYPIGTILLWAKTLTGVPGTLPTGWQEADGTGGTPDLNGSNYFLRGTSSTTTGTTGGAATHTHSQTYSGAEATGHNVYKVNISTDASLPSYYNIVYIIKIS